MRLLAFSDLHSDRRRAQRLVEMSAEADVVLCAGDLASFRLGLGRMIRALREIVAPTLLIPGNNETDTALRRACEGWDTAAVLHGEAIEIGATRFFGLGGGVPPTPFPFSFDLTEEHAAELFDACPEEAVMVVHSPPKGYADSAHGRNLGSTAVLRAIEAKHPPLVLCGHIHESWGCEATIGPTRLVNLGPDGMFFEL